MSWPHELAHELAAFDPPKGQAPAGGWHGADTEGRVGANNEGARSDTADDGQEDQLVASRRDSGDQQPNNAALEVEIRERGFQGTAGRTSRETELEASASRKNERILALYRDTMTFASRKEQRESHLT